MPLLQAAAKCDSWRSMARKRLAHRRFRLPARRSEAVALVALLIMSGLAIAGPSGLFAWSENLRLRDVRQTRLALLEVERDQLKNRVDLLEPAHSDPDLAGELVRSQMGVVHPDEVVVKIDN